MGGNNSTFAEGSGNHCQTLGLCGCDGAGLEDERSLGGSELGGILRQTMAADGDGRADELVTLLVGMSERQCQRHVRFYV